MGGSDFVVNDVGLLRYFMRYFKSYLQFFFWTNMEIEGPVIAFF